MYDFIATAMADKGTVVIDRYDTWKGGDPTGTLTFIVVNAENPLLIPAVENPTWKLQRVKMDNAHYALVRVVSAEDVLIAGDPLKL